VLPSIVDGHVPKLSIEGVHVGGVNSIKIISDWPMFN